MKKNRLKSQFIRRWSSSKCSLWPSTRRITKKKCRTERNESADLFVLLNVIPPSPRRASRHVPNICANRFFTNFNFWPHFSSIIHVGIGFSRSNLELNSFLLRFIFGCTSENLFQVGVILVTVLIALNY